MQHQHGDSCDTGDETKPIQFSHTLFLWSGRMPT